MSCLFPFYQKYYLKFYDLVFNSYFLCEQSNHGGSGVAYKSQHKTALAIITFLLGRGWAEGPQHPVW